MAKFFKAAIVVSLAAMVLGACNNNDDGKPYLFTLLPSTETGIGFANNVSYTEEFNPYTFRNFFNGGGVAIGDVNNDGLPDIFFCSNQHSNKLYLNKGNFKFDDITDKAGVSSEDIWSTGVTMADVNGDGLLDIYVCKSGDINGINRSNALFINNGNLTFTEAAKQYGLDNKGLSTHAVFFDYDLDGDLDCYLLNNSFKSVGNYDLVKDQRKVTDTLGGNKLYRNDNNHFTDVTQQAGIYSSKIGFGLGVTIADINKDGWPDIYVSNDFFEKDYLYINNRNGTFDEQLEKYVREISMNSMGADIADINNDSYPDIYVTDMLPEAEGRIKTKTTFENWNKYQSDIQNGYYKQFVRNVLQLNTGPVQTAGGRENMYFSEIGRYAGVCATDWSWGALITDLDNDGYKDIFVANGINKDITDQDYIQYTASPEVIRNKILSGQKNVITQLVDLIPSHPVSNYAFSNNKDLTFSNKAKEWGLATPSFSNGSAYADLDNDGDLDLVVNNVNMPCFVYRNESVQKHPENKYLKVVLKGEGKNTAALGSKVTVHYNGTIAYQEEMPMRGFESTVDSRLNFGLGNTKKIDSVVVQWPGGGQTVLKDVKPDTTLVIAQVKSEELKVKSEEVKSEKSKMKEADFSNQSAIFKPAASNYGLDFKHTENGYSDFDRDRLIFHMLSTQGPRIAKGDVNGDGLEDVYICAARGQQKVLYLQTPQGTFVKSNEQVFIRETGCEDTDALFFDADGDGDVDLFVCSGGNEIEPNSTDLISRLYINNGKGQFTLSPQILPSYALQSSSCVTAADYDGDGDMDLFVGTRLNPGNYGMPCKSYILQNNGKGLFTDITKQAAPTLLKAGMVTDAKWVDYDKDGKIDLAVTGEYMPLTALHNEGNGRLKDVTEAAGQSKSNGWWNRIEIADVNGDGYPDIIAGNHGLNSRFKATEDKPICMYVSDFDGNGTIEQVISCYNGDSSYPMALRHDLVSVLPYLKKKYLKYESYKNQRVEDVFTPEQLKAAVKLNAYTMQTSVFINNTKGGFERKALPKEAQLSPMYGITTGDFDKDGKMDILMGGNFYESKPEAGIYDASYGVFLKGDGKGGFTALPAQQSGFFVLGAVRDICTIKAGGKNLILVAKNNNNVQLAVY